MEEIISVVIPTYNRKNFLKEAVESVLRQNNVKKEVIVIDDGSTDGTSDLIKEYPVKYFFQENKGPSSARNLGILNSKGKYISFLDSDDLWLENKLFHQLKFLKENIDFPIVHTNEIWIRNGKPLKQLKKHKKGGGNQFLRSLELCVISPSSAMMKKDLFEKVGLFDEDFPACEDYEFWLRVTSRYKVGFIEKELVIKRGGHIDQLSKTIPCLDFWRAKAIGKLIKLNWFSDEQKKIAIEYFKKKASVYLDGLKKRKKIKERDDFEKWMKKILSH